MASYRFPDYSHEDYTERFEHRERDRYALASMGYGVIWYRMWWLLGMDRALEDTALDDGFVEELCDRIVESRLTRLRRILEADVDGVIFGDDWGTQKALMISPERWRGLFKPAYKRLFDVVHEAGRHVVFGTDGCTAAILPDWAEIGVDLLRVQLNVTGLDNVARLRGRTCLYSDPDRQHLLPHGTPEEVRARAREIIDALRTPEGGLIGSLYITEETPLRNVEAALDAFLGANPRHSTGYTG
jgi:uroporphyrinogen-III decarboxylase